MRAQIIMSIAALTIGGCTPYYDKNDWLAVSHEDTGIERVQSVHDSLKECSFRLTQFQWSGYVSYDCATGCAPATKDRVDCETTAARTDHLARPPQPVE